MEISVLDWLDKTVEKYSDKLMFSDENGEISFSQFDRCTKAIGAYLAKRVPKGSPVSVLSGRHRLAPAAFLGVVRAGCFYAPMDASMPQARLNQILNVINSEYMLVDKSLLKLASTLDFKGEIIVIDDIINGEADEAALARARETLTENSPLYVIFTSGSTGVPKGVITSHRSLMCYISSVGKVLNINSEDVLGNQAPLDYIAAIRDIYLPIKTGASSVIIPKNEFSMPAQLFETLNTHKVTTLCWSVAGIELPAKLGAFECENLKYLKKVCFSGSVMNCKYLKIWQENLPNALFVNQYGPTEATASCTYYVVEKPVDDTTVLPIGRPYDNYKIVVLNEDLSETKKGEIGELCIGGPCLALGYYGNREKSDEVFIQNPLNKNYRELIYRTGDLCRYNENGELEFHGRRDRQIKHMGHRIELGEIESTAMALEGVNECCALYQKEKSLLYLFYTGGASSKEIVLHFRKLLPAFMSPRKIVCLEQMPKLPNGKIDMQKLNELICNS